MLKWRRRALMRVSTLVAIALLCGLGWMRTSTASDSTAWLYEEGGTYRNVGPIAQAEFKNGASSFPVWIPEFVYVKERAGAETVETLPLRAYAMDFMLDPEEQLEYVMPTHDISYTFEQLPSLRGMESMTALEINRLRWILRHSMPYLETPKQCKDAFHIEGDLTKNDVVVATQIAIWSIVTQMYVTELPKDYPGRTSNAELYFEALMRKTRPAHEYDIESLGNVRYAGVRINAPVRHMPKPGVMGDFSVDSPGIGGDKVNVWLERLPYPIEGAESTVEGVLMESKWIEDDDPILLTGNEASEGKSPVVSVRQKEPFTLDTQSSGLISGAVRLYAQLPYKIAYQSELVVYGVVNEAGKSFVPSQNNARWQQASLITAGLFVGKPTQWVQLGWGDKAWRALPPETLQNKAAAPEEKTENGDFSLVESLEQMKGLSTVEDGALLEQDDPAIGVMNNMILSQERVYMVHSEQENAVTRFIKRLWR